MMMVIITTKSCFRNTVMMTMMMNVDISNHGCAPQNALLISKAPPSLSFSLAEVRPRGRPCAGARWRGRRRLPCTAAPVAGTSRLWKPESLKAINSRGPQPKTFTV